MAVWNTGLRLAIAVGLLWPSTALAQDDALEDWTVPDSLASCADASRNLTDEARLQACRDLLSSARFSGREADLLRYFVIGLQRDTLGTEAFADAMADVPGESLPVKYRQIRGTLLGEACFELERWGCALDAYTFPMFTGAVTMGNIDQIAIAMTRQSDSGVARQMADGFVANDPEWPGGYALRGYIRMEAADKAGAAQDMAKAATLMPPENHWALNSLCWAMVARLQQAKVARPACDATIAAGPDVAMYWDSHGAMLLALGHVDQALADYDRALAIDPDYAHARYGRAVALERLGRRVESDAEKAKALAAGADLAEKYGEYRLY
jgi:tetratricopeptide (TPR) repeat protein